MLHYCKWISVFLLSGSLCDYVNLEPYSESPLVARSYGYFSSFQDLVEEYNSKGLKSSFIDDALLAYDSHCSRAMTLEVQKIHPLIAIEGQFNEKRRRLAGMLRDRLNGVLIRNPPQFLLHLRPKVIKSPLRKIYFSIGQFGCACLIRKFLASCPVVVAGHWLSHFAFSAVAYWRLYHRLPPSQYVKWPANCTMPDLTFVLRSPVVPDNTQKQILQKFYSTWNESKVVELDEREDDEVLLTQISDVIKREIPEIRFYTFGTDNYNRSNNYRQPFYSPYKGASYWSYAKQHQEPDRETTKRHQITAKPSQKTDDNENFYSKSDKSSSNEADTITGEKPEEVSYSGEETRSPNTNKTLSTTRPKRAKTVTAKVCRAKKCLKSLFKKIKFNKFKFKKMNILRNNARKTSTCFYIIVTNYCCIFLVHTLHRLYI